MIECVRIAMRAVRSARLRPGLVERYLRFVWFARSYTCGNCDGLFFRDRSNLPPPSSIPFTPLCPTCRRRVGYVEPWLQSRYGGAS